MTPNTEDDQQRDYADYIRQVNGGRQASTYKSSPPLLSCPCCGNRLIREVENNKVIGEERLLTGKQERFRDVAYYNGMLYSVTDGGSLYKISKQ